MGVGIPIKDEYEVCGTVETMSEKESKIHPRNDRFIINIENKRTIVGVVSRSHVDLGLPFCERSFDIREVLLWCFLRIVLPFISQKP